MVVIDDRARAKNFILNGEMIGKERYSVLENTTLKQHGNDLLSMRGLFTYEILNHVLMKRWNVDFGIREGGPGKIAMFIEGKNNRVS